MAKNNTKFFEKKELWSEIKDRLLGCYLPAYFQKLLKTRSPIYYVDCFAGKGRFDDGKPGSPIIALDIRNSCISKTKLDVVKNAISTCFIDYEHALALQENIKDYNNEMGVPNVINGKYEDNIVNILADKKNYNVFLYIDPYGIKALDFSLFEKFNSLGFRTFEMLINFNSFGFFRDACRAMSVEYKKDNAFLELDDLKEYDPTIISNTPQSVDLLTKIAGGDYWKAIVNDYNAGKIDGYKAEQRLSSEYKDYLKTKFTYVLDIPIRLKPNSRPKYRMIHICNHEDGCFLMAQNMQNRKDELFLNIQQKGQDDFFETLMNNKITVEGEAVTESEIKEMVVQHLIRLSPAVRMTKFIASFVNQYGLICDFKVIHDILNALEAESFILLDRTPPITETGKRSTFMQEKGDHRLTIKVLNK